VSVSVFVCVCVCVLVVCVLTCDLLCRSPEMLGRRGHSLSTEECVCLSVVVSICLSCGVCVCVLTLDLMYRSPEMLGRRGHSLPTDLWSVGVLTFELLCGGAHRPFDGATPAETQLRILSHDSPPPLPLQYRRGGVTPTRKGAGACQRASDVSIYPSTYLPVHRSTYISPNYLSIYLSVYLSIAEKLIPLRRRCNTGGVRHPNAKEQVQPSDVSSYPSTYPPIHLPIHLPTYLSIYLPTYLPTYYLSIHLPTNLSVCFPIAFRWGHASRDAVAHPIPRPRSATAAIPEGCNIHMQRSRRDRI